MEKANKTDKLFLAACRGEPVSHTPIWLNRQAGRYMPEYLALKGDTPSLELFTDPEKSAQATLDAQRILGVDAAIMFADLLPILVPMGLDLDYVADVGPLFANPLRSAKDVYNLVNAPAEEATPYIADTVRNINSGLPADIALIGFAGAPFTLASYAIEGKGSRNYTFVKKLMYEAPTVWHELMRKLVTQLTSYLRLQMDAGVDAVQIFDSWVGCLSTSDFAEYVVPHLRRMLEQIGGRVPVIYFATGNHHLLPQVADVGFDVLAFDWRTPLAETWDTLGCKSVQGNLDPIVLCADQASIASQAQRILDEVGGRSGHIFNLGHGIIPQTPVANVKFLVEYVQEHSQNT